MQYDSDDDIRRNYSQIAEQKAILKSLRLTQNQKTNSHRKLTKPQQPQVIDSFKIPEPYYPPIRNNQISYTEYKTSNQSTHYSERTISQPQRRFRNHPSFYQPTHETEEDILQRMVDLSLGLSSSQSNQYYSVRSSNDEELERIMHSSLHEQQKTQGLTSYEKEMIDRTATRANKSLVDLKKSCSICLNEFKLAEKVVLLPCLEYFHFDCISPWIEKHQTCPTCRLNISNALKK